MHKLPRSASIVLVTVLLATTACGGMRRQEPTSRTGGAEAAGRTPASDTGSQGATDANPMSDGSNSKPIDPDQPVSSPALEQPGDSAKEHSKVQVPGSNPTVPPSPPGQVPPSPPTPPTPPTPGPPEIAPGTIRFRTVEHGFYSGVTERTVQLLTDAEGWNALWARHARRQHPAPSAPPVNFANESVIAAYMGEQTSGGYGVEITSVQWNGTRLTVTVHQRLPEPGSMVTMALTQPYHLVAIPRVPSGTTISVQWQ